MLTRARMISTLSCLGLVTGCAMDDLAEEDLEQIGEVEEEVTQGQLIPTNQQWAVKLRIDEEPGFVRTCSGVVLSEHWVLTAAHCVESAIDLWGVYEADRLVIQEQAWDGDLTTPTVYGAGTEGAASFYLHPDYDGSRRDDIALVRLYHAGIADVQKGRFWYDQRAPWSSSASLSIAGFGRGSFSYVDECDDVSVDGRGRYGNFTWDEYKNSWEAQAVSDQSVTCQGDAGGPWWVRRGSRDLVVAVQSGTDETIWGEATGTMVGKLRWQWITDTASAKGIPLSCPQYQTTDGYIYKVCSE